MKVITPRAVSQWKPAMRAEGVGRETVRKQAVWAFTGVRREHRKVLLDTARDRG